MKKRHQKNLHKLNRGVLTPESEVDIIVP